MNWIKITDWRDLPRHKGKILLIASHSSFFGIHCRALRYSDCLRDYETNEITNVFYDGLEWSPGAIFSDKDKDWAWLYYMVLDEPPMGGNK